MNVLADMAAALRRGDEQPVALLAQQALEHGLAPQTILNDGLIAGMAVVGAQFKAHEIYLPDVLLAARAMYAGLDVLRPKLAAAGVPAVGKIVLGSVQGDLHDIGKNLVAIMLRGAGFEVIDLGSDVPPEKFVAAAQTHGARVIGMSALLTTTMPVMKKVVALLREAGLAGQVKTIIGGAPVSDAYAHQIGADAHGFDCVSAVERVKVLTATTNA